MLSGFAFAFRVALAGPALPFALAFAFALALAFAWGQGGLASAPSTLAAPTASAFSAARSCLAFALARLPPGSPGGRPVF